MKVFDSIVEWVMHHSLQDPSIWQNEYSRPSRSSFIGTIARIFRTEHLFPKMKPVELVGGEILSLPYFDFTDMFLSLVTDKKLNQPKYLIEKDLTKHLGNLQKL